MTINKIQVSMIENEEYEGELKKNVTLDIFDDAIEGGYCITKYLEIVKDKTDDEYVKDAYALMTDQITEWQNSKKSVGKTFNPSTGKIE